MDIATFVREHVMVGFANAFTTLPGQVVNVKTLDSGGTVVDVQTGVNYLRTDSRAYVDGVIEDIPLVWPSAGGCFITTPIEIGDSVLLHFGMRNCSEWKRNGDKTNIVPFTPLMLRYNDINDAFAVPAALFFSETPAVDQQAVRISSGATEIRILKNGTIELGAGATERLIKGDAFLSAFLAHTHTYVNSSALSVLTTAVSTVKEVPDMLADWEDTLSTENKTT